MMVDKPINIGVYQLKNRIIVPPIVRQLADDDGNVSDKLIENYILHARSGASMLIVEASYIQKNGQILPRQLSIESDERIDGLSRLAKSIKQQGIPALIQIVHAGRMGCNANLVAPSAIPFENRTTPKALDAAEIDVLKDDFTKASQRAILAGFDGVEIHIAHGYILSQFLSPLANKRDDLYGGSLENRSRLSCEIIKSARSVIGKDKILSVRFGACDCSPGGLKLSESIEISKIYANLGVDLLNISIGITPTLLGGSRTRKLMGFVPLAREIKKNVNVAVATVGKITTKEGAQTIIEDGKADLVCVCRSLLADPKWPAKVLGESEEPISACKSCKICVHFSTGCPN